MNVYLLYGITGGGFAERIELMNIYSTYELAKEAEGSYDIPCYIKTYEVIDELPSHSKGSE